MLRVWNPSMHLSNWVPDNSDRARDPSTSNTSLYSFPSRALESQGVSLCHKVTNNSLIPCVLMSNNVGWKLTNIGQHFGVYFSCNDLYHEYHRTIFVTGNRKGSDTVGKTKGVRSNIGAKIQQSKLGKYLVRMMVSTQNYWRSITSSYGDIENTPVTKARGSAKTDN